MKNHKKYAKLPQDLDLSFQEQLEAVDTAVDDFNFSGSGFDDDDDNILDDQEDEEDDDEEEDEIVIASAAIAASGLTGSGGGVRLASATAAARKQQLNRKVLAGLGRDSVIEKRRLNLQCPLEDINTLQNTTSLKSGQIMHLYKCFYHLAKDSTDIHPLYLKKAHFLSLTSLQRNPILSTLLRSMFNDKKHLSFVDFAKYLSNFQTFSRNLHPDQLEKRKQQKLRLIFNMYDHDKNGFISEDELMFIVDKLFGDIWSSEQIMNVASMMMTEMDTSNTNQILFDDFCKAFAIFDMEHWLVTKIPG